MIRRFDCLNRPEMQFQSSLKKTFFLCVWGEGVAGEHRHIVCPPNKKSCMKPWWLYLYAHALLYRHVSIAVSFPESVLHYWSSKAHQRGIKCTINKASFSVNYLLSLVTYDPGLYRRPRANWTILNCSGGVENILAHVKTKTVVRTAEGEVVDLEVSSSRLHFT